MKEQQIKYIKSQKLVDKAYGLIQKYDFDKALEIGKRLSSYELECGFEIQARAYESMEEKKKALKVLLKGAEILPRSWCIRQSLGTYHANLKEHEKAIEYYNEGLDIAYSSIIQLRCNRAIDLLQLGKLNEALDDARFLISLLNTDVINTIPLITLRSGAGHVIFLSVESQISSLTNAYYNVITAIEASYALLIFIYNELGEYDKAKEAFEEFFSKYNIDEFIQIDEEYGEYSPGLSAIYSSYTMTLWKSDKTDKALELIKKAILLNKWNKNAQYLIREIRSNNDYSNAKCMRIYLNGQFNRSSIGGKNFIVCYLVIADDEAEALEFIKEFEPEEIRDSLKIEREVEILDNAPQRLKGVYECSSYICFPLEEEN